MDINELKQSLADKKAEVRSFLDNNDVPSAESAMNEVRSIEKQISIAEELEARELAELQAQQSNNETRSDLNMDNNIEVREIELSTEEKEVRAFESFVRSGKFESRDLTVADQGVIVPKSIADKIIERVKELSPILNMATIYNVNGKLSIPVANGEITASYQGAEFTEITESTMGFTSIDLAGHVVASLTKISKSLITNSQFDITSFIVDKVAKSIADFLGKELINGSTKIKGLTSSTNIVNSANSGYVVADDLIDLTLAIPAVYVPNASYIMNKNNFKAITKLKNADGDYLVQKDLVLGVGYSILGSHIHIDENVADDEIFFGDYSGLVFKISKDVELQVLNEKYATQLAIGVIASAEVDGAIADNQKIAKLKIQA